jgi:hypothetical protein
LDLDSSDTTKRFDLVVVIFVQRKYADAEEPLAARIPRRQKAATETSSSLHHRHASLAETFQLTNPPGKPSSSFQERIMREL